jgi:hypothetical protein
MMIRWKNKNPYINFFRECSRVVLSSESFEKKIELIESMTTRNYEGSWLYAHPSHKYIGNGVPQNGDDVSSNPYFQFLEFARSVLRKGEDNVFKFNEIKQELAWVSRTLSSPKAQDWVYTD